MLHIKTTKNNTFLTLSNYKGDVFYTKNGGSADIKKKSKAACMTICYYMLEKIKNIYLFSELDFIFKGNFKK